MTTHLPVFSLPPSLLQDLRLRRIRIPAGHPLQERLPELRDLTGLGIEQDNESDSSEDDSDVSSIVSSSEDEPEEESQVTKAQNHPLVWLEAPNVAPGTQFGFYRSVLPFAGEAKGFRRMGRQATEGQLLDEIEKCQLGPERKVVGHEESTPRYWAILLYGGGHFAGMIANVRPKAIHRGKNLAPKYDADIVASKTFHRYTTRRKQGGSQSAQDSSGSKPKSAGATLRRYNEAALESEVRELLFSWSSLFEQCDVIFLRVGRRAYSTFIENAPFDRDDARVRMLPFETNRPTIHELTHVYRQLAVVKTTHLSQEALEKLDLDYVQKVLPKNKPQEAPKEEKPEPQEKAPQVPTLSTEERIVRDRWERLVDMVSKGKVAQVAALYEKYDEELRNAHLGETFGELPPWIPGRTRTPTLLHVAALGDHPEMVKWLLVDKRSDPSLKAGYDLFSHRPMAPYEMAPSRETRDVFRQVAAEHPDWCDWMGTGPSGARVQTTAKEDKEAERRAKLKEKQAAQREKAKDRRTADAPQEDASEQDSVDAHLSELARQRLQFEESQRRQYEATGARRLGTSADSAPSATLLGFSAQDRARIERERRARAAEARMKK